VRTTRKVLAYITKGERLLVFRHRDHPHAGLQVPAGTVRAGETTRRAVLREAYEETGLTSLQLIGLLGWYRHDMAPYRTEKQDRYVYHLHCQKAAPLRWLHLERHARGVRGPIAFQFFWIRLNHPQLELVAGQGRLLGRLAAAQARLKLR
jgi:ADP-ribose pyrophosphatase YjhB (NUDIX family)